MNVLEATDAIRFFEIIIYVMEILEPQKGHEGERKLEII